MKEKIRNLYQALGEISVSYLIYQERNNIEKIKKFIPQIQEFVLWFLEENKLGIEEDLYQDLSKNLVYILEDISTALEQEDMVLLHDSMAYGLLEYLEAIVVDEKQENHIDDNV